ncbi:acyltransferase family protein [Sphingobium sp.]|uniref:acyltransferase family protein n=1 Tax=Sphingobium sp. TaxID=1912891 RepID=UPI003BB5AE4C
MMATETAGRAERYVALDAMRGVAALLVVILHSERMLQGQWAPGGYLAVDMFFALSGFVIAHSYDARIAAGLSSLRFVTLRAIRFWPLYVLGLSLGILHQLLLILTHNDHAMSFGVLALASFLALIFVPGPVRHGGNLYPLNAPSWSLFMELIANAAYAIAFPKLTARVLGVIAVIGGLGFAILCLRHGSADLGATIGTLAGGVARTAFSFAVGLLIYRKRWRPFALPVPMLAAIVTLLLICPVPSGWRAIYDIVFVLILSPVLVAVGASSRPSPRLMGVSARVGLVSYPVYAIHRPLIDIITPVVEKLQIPPLVAAILFVVGLILLGLMLDRFFDQRVRRIITVRLGLRQERPLPEASLP